MKKIAVIFGTRPEAIKLCPVVLALQKDPAFDCKVCVTGQHKEMLYQVLNVFGVKPDVDLQLMRPNQTLGGLTSRAIAAIDEYLAITAKVSVPEWLAKIAASDFVFTNSFHGTVFAILFHRPFVSILLRGRMSGMNERALSLLKKLGLESRAVYADDTAAIEAALASPIDWEKVDSARVACAEGSRRFINDCL